MIYAELRDHYERRGRIEASRNLLAALVEAEQTIENRPDAGLSSPRPYPGLSRPGRRWIKAGRYWITYSLDQPPVILGVFYDAADIPGRL